LEGLQRVIRELGCILISLVFTGCAFEGSRVVLSIVGAAPPISREWTVPVALYVAPDSANVAASQAPTMFAGSMCRTAVGFSEGLEKGGLKIYGALFRDLRLVTEASRVPDFAVAIAPAISSWNHDYPGYGSSRVNLVLTLRVYERGQPVWERIYPESGAGPGMAILCDSGREQIGLAASQAVTRALMASAGDLAIDARMEATLGPLEAQRQKTALAPTATERAEMARYVAVARARSSALTAEQRRVAQGKFEQGFELFRAGEFRAAVLRFDEGLEIDPANGVAHFYLGESHARLGEARRAALQYRLTLELAPDTKEAAIAKTKLE